MVTYKPEHKARTTSAYLHWKRDDFTPREDGELLLHLREDSTISTLLGDAKVCKGHVLYILTAI